MKNEKKLKVSRSERDDILDALSLRINQKLKTEKAIDDQKNNVYFWLFKFIILILYLVFINIAFDLIRDLGTDLIYYFAVSLRSVFSGIWEAGMSLSKWIIILYSLFRNLKIFMNSKYFKKLYSNDRKMVIKKNKCFNIIYLVLKYLSVPFLVILSVLALILLTILTMLLYMVFNGLYMVSAILIVIVLFALTYMAFKAIQGGFFGSNDRVHKESIMIALGVLFIGIIAFSYETSSYDHSDTLPANFEIESKISFFDISKINKIKIKSGSKYENIHVNYDDNLGDKMRVEISYYDTAKVCYTYYYNDNNDLYLKFDSTMEFGYENVEDVVKLGVETIQNQTLYNYNLFKYPTINIYISHNNAYKLSVFNYKGTVNSSIKK